MPDTIEIAIEMLKMFEGCRLEAYDDGGGVWTIGYGHTLGVHKGDIWVQETADFWLKREVDTTHKAVLARLTTPVSGNQLAAMISLCYNIGVGAFAASTVLAKHNDSEWQTAADAFLLWDKQNGKVLNGLVRRRETERSLYLR